VAFGRVNDQFQAALQVLADTAQHAIARSLPRRVINKS
jgi:hypothetical protein